MTILILFIFMIKTKNNVDDKNEFDLFEHFVQVFIVTLLIPLIIHLNGLWNERQWCNIVGSNGKEIKLA